jgi:hypothetical protein
VTKSADATYTFSIYQQNGGSPSGAVGVSWTRDALPPLAPVITAPGISPYTSSSGNLLISGTCENNANVNLSGAATNMVQCSGGSFSFNVAKTNNATYNFNLTQTDLAGNTSAGSTLQWILDSTPPTSPTMTSPASSPLVSNGNSINVAGACENGATVNLTGASTQNVTCATNAYSFTVSKTTDGTYDLTVHQTDLAGQISSSVTKQWIRDTSAPSTPTITNPASNPLTSNATNLTIAGNCENGATITYSGAATGTANCLTGAYSFNISKAIDGTYNFSITQTDSAGNTSAGTSLQWNRLSSIPATPMISSPTSNPYYGKLNSLTLTGTCETGNSVQLSGAESQTTTCASNSFSITLNQSANGTFNYSITQVNGASVASGAASFSWIVDTVSPSTPVITSPSSNPLNNSANSVTILGTCEANSTVNYTGAATGSTTCSGAGAFSFASNKTTDGIYNYSISQTDLAGNVSGSSSFSWRRDTLAPAAPSLTLPSANPYTSGDTNITITVSCEANATLTMTGGATLSGTCSGLGTSSFNISKTTDATYNFSITQKDLANNVSSPLNFQWVRDTSIPFTPVFTVPIDNPYYASSSSVSISMTCQTGLSPAAAVVSLSGISTADVVTPAGQLTQDCTSSPVTFVVQKNTDGIYDLSVSQENPNNNNVSADAIFSWHRDTVAPVAPTVTSPATTPYTGPGNITLAGACESNATVYVAGDTTQNTVCSGGTYSFSIIKSVDATYNFSVTQVDLAGNTSTARTQTWVRNSDSLPAPVVTSPVTTPYASNFNDLTLSGTCEPNYIVTLGGNVVASEVSVPSNSLTTTCTSGGTFTFTLTKSTDATYNLNLTQTFNGATSAATNFAWTLDLTEPTTTLATSTSDPNLVGSITFTFTADEPSTFQCQINGGAFQSCSSPATFSGLTNGPSSLTVIATDAVGNIGAEATHTWTQAAYNAVALYHLNAGTAQELSDSGLFTANSIFSNNLTANGSPATNTSGKYPTSAPASFILGTSKYFSVDTNDSFKSTASTMTLEGLFNFSSFSSSTGRYYTLFSNTNSASPDLGWELRLEKQNSGGCSKWKLKFLASLNGTTQSTATSSCISLSTSRWYHVAMTWNKGSVKFYMNSSGGSSKGTATIGTAGSSVLFTPNAPIKIGAGPSSGTGSALWISGSIDEVRISNTVRTPSFPSTEFTPD